MKDEESERRFQRQLVYYDSFPTLNPSELQNRLYELLLVGIRGVLRLHENAKSLLLSEIW